MSPEERAKDLCDTLNLTDGDEAALASAIRAAENEALERAAVLADREEREGLAEAERFTAEEVRVWFKGYSQCGRTTAFCIRSLKHPETP